MRQCPSCGFILRENATAAGEHFCGKCGVFCTTADLNRTITDNERRFFELAQAGRTAEAEGMLKPKKWLFFFQAKPLDANVRFPKNGFRPLHVAVSQQRNEFVAMLLRNGADVNATGYDGRTPLHMASILDAAQCALLLVDGGADLNARTRAGITPLYDAASSDSPNVLSLLLDRGADPTISHSSGKESTALHAAAEKGYSGVALKLAQRTSIEDLSACIKHAAWAKHTELAQHLQEALAKRA